MTSMLQSSKSSNLSSISVSSKTSSSKAFLNHSSTLEFSFRTHWQLTEFRSHSSKGFLRLFSYFLLENLAQFPPGTTSHPSNSCELSLFTFSILGLRSQLLIFELEIFSGRVKFPGREFKEVVMTELANQGFFDVKSVESEDRRKEMFN